MQRTPWLRLGLVPRRRALLGLGGALALAAGVLLAPQAPMWLSADRKAAEQESWSLQAL